MTYTYAIQSKIVKGFTNSKLLSFYLMCFLILSSILLKAQGEPAFLITTTNTVLPCHGDGRVDLTVSGGVAPYTYYWYYYNDSPFYTVFIDSTTVPFLSNLQGGDYLVGVRDSTGVVANKFFTLPAPFTLQGSLVDDTCPGNTGSVTVTATGGSIPYSYVWSNGAVTQSITGLSGGQYNVTVTDASGCQMASDARYQAFKINTVASFSLTLNVTDATCTPNSGECSVSQINGGTAPFTYQWNSYGIPPNPLWNTPTIMNVGRGNYSVTVTDGDGCSATGNTYVNFYSTITLSDSTVKETCGRADGSASVFAGGATAPYTYLWSNGDTTATADSLSSNLYNVTVSDANGCQTSTSLYISNFSPVNLSIAKTEETCNQVNGTAAVVANGGTSPYSYLWNNGVTTAYNNFLSAGGYSVTVTDTLGCQSISYANINKYSPIMANLVTIQDTCGAGLGGSVSVSPTMGTAPYQYIWSNGSTASALSNLPTGNYSITITDAVGCSVYKSTDIRTVSPIAAHETHTSQICAGALGTITLAPTGGSLPYTYNWSGGQTTASLTGLLANYYYYTITDANACTKSGSVNIQLNSTLSASVTTLANEACIMQNGALKCATSGGTTPYTYLWSNAQTTDNIIALSAGNYRVTITDANGCEVRKTGYVGRTSPMYANISVTPASCIFTADGSALVNVTNGTPPYTYHWGNGSTTNTAINLPANWGIGVSIADANGCEAHTYNSAVGYSGTACATIISGRVVDDMNSNCMDDVGDIGLRNIVVSCTPGSCAITNITGDYQFLMPPANYAVTQNAPYFHQICPIGSILLDNCAADSSYVTNNFYNSHLNIEDLRVSINNVTPPKPGLNHTISIVCFNNGSATVNAQVALNYDAGVLYIGGGSSVNTLTRVVTINFNNIPPVNGSAVAYLTFTTPSSTPLGTIQTYTAHATPDANDATLPNNTEITSCTVVASYDPNDKEVEPKGNGSQGYITTDDSLLKYTIHFQNTGNYPASFVAIRDTLDPNLDITTVQAGASSHDYKMQIMNGNVLAFLFDPINLTDTATDEAGSHGMVTFYIRQKGNLPGGTEIRNKASIFFDFNDPITTNTTLNTIEQGVGIKEVENDMAMKLLPNPGNGFTNLQVTLQQNFEGDLQVYDMLGKKVITQSVNLNAGTQTIPLSFAALAQGVYTIKLVNAHTSHEIKYVNQ